MPINWLNHEFVVQHSNGQCIILLNGKQPKTQRSVEIYVRGIPRNFGPNELIPVFSCAGLVHSVRLLMDYGQHNRGFAYVRYVYPRDIARAFRALNGMRIALNHRLELTKCRDWRAFCIYNIYNYFTTHTVSQTMLHLVHVQNFQCKVFHDGKFLVAMLTFPSNREYVRAYSKANHSRNIFGPTCWLKHCKPGSRTNSSNHSVSNI